MNMKKTIAAIAAGAVAVSAMATSVSALSDQAFTYNLVKEYKSETKTDSTATYEVTYSGIAPAATTLYFQANDVAPNAWTTAADDVVTGVILKVTESTTGEQNKIYTWSTDIKAVNYYAGIKLDTAGYWTIEMPTEFASFGGTEYDITATIYTTTIADTADDINSLIGTSVLAGTTTDMTECVPTLKAITAGETKEESFYAPFKTQLRNNTEITSYLTGNGYNNVDAVINDAIENYESVTFTFNTATNGIVWVPAAEVSAKDIKTFYGTQQWGGAGTYATGLAAANGIEDNLVALYSSEWYADNSYKAFDQHLYTGFYAPEGTTWTGFDWSGYNLFQGALVINEGITMSLAETDYFDWTATSLSFDWDAIMDGAMTSNGYATWLHTMELATSNTWYWDSMTVTLTAGAADDVTSDAGAEADDETLDEEVEEEEVTEEVVEEEEEEEEVVANPTTGNASVALAVIPVALAAAAVVAKKRS